MKLNTLEQCVRNVLSVFPPVEIQQMSMIVCIGWAHTEPSGSAILKPEV